MDETKKSPTTVGGVPTGDFTESGNPTHKDDGTFGSASSSISSEAKEKLKSLLEKRRQMKRENSFYGFKEAYDKQKSYIKSLENFDQARENNRRITGDFNKKLTPQQNEIFNTALTKAFNENIVGTRIRFDNLIKVFDTNKFINLHEAGRGGGCENSTIRMRFSHECFGSKYETERVNRYPLEKYGCLLSSDFGKALNRGDGASQYGDAVIAFKKDRIKGRATYTIGDSLANNRVIPTLIGDKFDANSFASSWGFTNVIGSSSSMERIKNAKNIGELKEALGVGYIECQYHGDITNDEIDFVIVQDIKVKSNNPDLIRVMNTVLNKKGIKVYTHDYVHHKDYEVKIGENGKLYQEEVKR